MFMEIIKLKKYGNSYWNISKSIQKESLRSNLLNEDLLIFLIQLMFVSKHGNTNVYYIYYVNNIHT